MPQVEYNIVYGKNSDLVISPAELLELYFFGIKIDQQQGVDFSNETLRFYIDAAQQELENYLTIKLKRQIIEEKKDFYRKDFENWSYLRVTYPVVDVKSLKGFISDNQQIEYPEEWLSVRTTNDGKLYHRNVYLVPGSDAARTNSIVYSGISPHLGYFGVNQIPNYWKVRYCTGFEKVPSDLIDIVGKLAAINMFNVLGDIVLGSGIAAQSISIDNLSQNIQTTQSAENSAYSARIRMYLDELKRKLPQMKDYYYGIRFGTM